jgi:hypothetical protein
MSHSDVLSTSGPSKSMVATSLSFILAAIKIFFLQGVFSNLLALQLVTKEEGESLTKSYIFSYDLFQSEVGIVMSLQYTLRYCFDPFAGCGR